MVNACRCIIHVICIRVYCNNIFDMIILYIRMYVYIYIYVQFYPKNRSKSQKSTPHGAGTEGRWGRARWGAGEGNLTHTRNWGLRVGISFYSFGLCPLDVWGTRMRELCYSSHQQLVGRIPTIKNQATSRQKTSFQLVAHELHPRKLTWNLTTDPWKRRFLLKTIIFRFQPLVFRGSGFGDKSHLGINPPPQVTKSGCWGLPLLNGQSGTSLAKSTESPETGTCWRAWLGEFEEMFLS